MVKFDDTKGVIRSVNLRRTDNTMVKFDDTKGVIRRRKSKKDRQHNGQVLRYQRGNQKP
jgi:ribosomal protein L14